MEGTKDGTEEPDGEVELDGCKEGPPETDGLKLGWLEGLKDDIARGKDVSERHAQLRMAWQYDQQLLEILLLNHFRLFDKVMSGL
eukprot:scaffold13832_cov228-Alexandrium_tamarense.AAC.2